MGLLLIRLDPVRARDAAEMIRAVSSGDATRGSAVSPYLVAAVVLSSLLLLLWVILAWLLGRGRSSRGSKR